MSIDLKKKKNDDDDLKKINPPKQDDEKQKRLREQAQRLIAETRAIENLPPNMNTTSATMPDRPVSSGGTVLVRPTGMFITLKVCLDYQSHSPFKMYF